MSGEITLSHSHLIPKLKVDLKFTFHLELAFKKSSESIKHVPLCYISVFSIDHIRVLPIMEQRHKI